MLWIGGAWLAGTLLAHELPELPSARWCVPLLLATLLAFRCAPLRPVVIIAVAFAWTCWSATERLAERLPPALLGRDFELAGTVSTFPTPAPGQITFALDVAEPRPQGVPGRVRLTWYDAPTGLRLGDRLRITARLRPPRGARNPGGFDYEQWLLANDYGATGYVRSGAIASVGSSAFVDSWHSFRASLAEGFAATSADGDGVALLTALALGERFRFTEQHWADFRRTGTSHLVAVSGMHVALLGVVVFFVLRRLWLRLPAGMASFDLEAAAAASIAATVYYAALTGFAVPAQRSVVMIAFALAATVSRRRIGPAQLVAVTLLAVLVFDPFAPLSASFWLSFAAVAILLALAAPRQIAARPANRAVRGARLLLEVTRLQAWIGLALLPLTAWIFGEVSLVGPLVNLVAIPFFNACLVPLAVLATMGLTFDALSDLVAPLVASAAALAGMTARALHTVAELPAAAISLPTPPTAASLTAAAGVALGVWGRGLPGCRLVWLALVPLWLPEIRVPPDGVVRAVVLDVGHGLAVLVETRSHRLLFDAGPTSRSGFDSGEEIVVPALRAHGRRGLDRLLVSHADNDHAGGAAAVVAAFPEVDVLGGRDVALPGGRACVRGEEWSWDGVSFRVLHPRVDFAASSNDGSCVLKVTAGGRSLLVTGDIERRGEEAVLDEDLAADVVVVPHHGSATSSSPAFVSAVRARWAVVSAAHANRWGFPRAEVRDRWQRSGATVVVTGDVGAVSIELQRNDVKLEAERDRRHRYWHAP